MKIPNTICKNKDIIFVFLLTFLLFALIQFSTTNLAGNDSYLYIKLAELTKNNGLIKEFPWLNATIMKDNFTGLHFLYYILLIPFTFFGNLVFGAKIASLFFLSVMAAVFYITLKKLKLKYSFFWFLFLLASSGYWLFRMNLARPLSFSVIFLLVVFYILIQIQTVQPDKRRLEWVYNLLLFAVSFLYVWAHGSFPLAIFLTLTFVVLNYIYGKKIYYKTALASLGGIIFAVLINPFFPNNINYFSIYYLNRTPYQLTAQIMEWQPISIYQIFYDAPVLLISFLILSAIFCVKFILRIINSNGKNGKLSLRHQKLSLSGSFPNNKKIKDVRESENEIIASFLFTISAVFFVGMLLQGRFIDYWVPFSVIFVAFYAESLIKTPLNPPLSGGRYACRIHSGDSPAKPSYAKGSTALSGLWIQYRNFFSAENIKIFSVSVLAVIIAFSIWSRANFVLSECGTDKSNKNIREISLWLKENTPERSIVFNANWGDFSKMFFYNARNYYTVGLDGKFIYQLSPKKYWFYTHLSDGIVCDKEKCGEEDNNNSLSVYEILKNEFNADYVFVPLAYEGFDYTNLINILNSDSRFEKVYENEGGEIWKLE